MRTPAAVLAVVGLLATQSLALLNVQVQADSTSIPVGGTATVAINVKAGAGAGVAALAGSVVATGTGLTASGLAFAHIFDRTDIAYQPWPAHPGGEFPSVVGSADTNGGWASFGSCQAWNVINGTVEFLPFQDTAVYGNDAWVTFATYTVTANAPGAVTLNFVPSKVSGFLPVTTDANTTIGTNLGTSITVTPEPMTMALLALGGLLVARRRRRA